MDDWFGLAPAGQRMRSCDVDTESGLSARLPDFDAVFRRYAPYVGAIVLKLVGRAGDVDDVVQDVFIQVSRGLHLVRDPEAIRPWLTRIAVRRSHRWLKRHWHRRLFVQTETGNVDDMVDPAASPEQRAEIARVYGRLQRLPADERIVWALRAVEGETLESIATLVGCSLSTVQRRFRAAQAFMERVT